MVNLADINEKLMDQIMEQLGITTLYTAKITKNDLSYVISFAPADGYTVYIKITDIGCTISIEYDNCLIYTSPYTNHALLINRVKHELRKHKGE